MVTTVVASCCNCIGQCYSKLPLQLAITVLPKDTFVTVVLVESLQSSETTVAKEIKFVDIQLNERRERGREGLLEGKG